MKQEKLHKSLFLPIAIFSLFAFVAVNLHASLTSPLQGHHKQELPQPTRVEDATDQADRDLAIPDVTVLGRLFDLAQRLLPKH